METIAVYWEPKPKTYGFREAEGLSLLSISVEPEKMAQWGRWFLELTDLDIDFYLISVKYTNHKELRLYIILEKFWGDKILSNIANRIDLEFEKNIISTSPVELISFQGPHFGDRYGIAEAAFKALDDQGIPILIAACSGASVYIVLPKNKLDMVKHFLEKAFHVP